MDRQTIEDALAKVGVTDAEKQRDFFVSFSGKSVEEISPEDVVAELGKLGVTDEQKQADFLAAVKEPEILDQALDMDELSNVSGGTSCDTNDADRDHCVQQLYRDIHKWDKVKRDWLSNCAATVEVAELCFGSYVISHCGTNDGCASYAVIYIPEG